MNFLSHTISADSIRPHISRVEAVRAFPVPNDMTSLHRFVGLINYYHRFVPYCAEIIQPLHQALAAKTLYGMRRARLYLKQSNVHYLTL